MLKNNYKIMFGFIKNMFFQLLSFSGSLASMTNASNFITCVSLNNETCMAGPTLVDLNP